MRQSTSITLKNKNYDIARPVADVMALFTGIEHEEGNWIFLPQTNNKVIAFHKEAVKDIVFRDVDSEFLKAIIEAEEEQADGGGNDTQ